MSLLTPFGALGNCPSYSPFHTGALASSDNRAISGQAPCLPSFIQMGRLCHCDMCPVADDTLAAETRSPW